MFRGIQNGRIGDVDTRRGGNVEIPNGAEMQFPTVNKAHQTRNSEKEAGTSQTLEILEYLREGEY